MNLALAGKDSKRLYLICGVVATLFVGMAVDLLAQHGLDRDVASILVFVPVIAVLVAVFPESLNFNKMTILWAAMGVGLGLVFFEVKFGRAKVSLQASTGATAYLYYVMSVAVLQPFFEEFVVRRLLFFGGAEIVGPILSAIFVSILFGLLHRDICVFAGVFSLIMCWMAWKGVSTFNRAVLHGFYNLTLAIIMIVGGLAYVA